MSILNQIVSFVKFALVSFIILMFAFFFMGYIEANNLVDKNIHHTLNIVNDRYTPEFIYSDEYWTKRDKFYTLKCPIADSVNRNICAESRELSHEEYINDRYDSLYERIERIENGSPFDIRRWFSMV